MFDLFKHTIDLFCKLELMYPTDSIHKGLIYLLCIALFDFALHLFSGNEEEALCFSCQLET